MYRLKAAVRSWARHEVTLHEHGTYPTANDARWWAINAKGVWKGGPTGPRTKFYPLHRIMYWQIDYA